MSGAAALSAARNRRTNPANNAKNVSSNASCNAVKCTTAKKGAPAPVATGGPQLTKAQQYAVQQQQQQQAAVVKDIPFLQPIQVLRLHDIRLSNIETEMARILNEEEQGGSPALLARLQAAEQTIKLLQEQLQHFQEQQTPVPSDDEDGEEVEKAAADTTVVAFTDNLGKLFRSSSQGCWEINICSKYLRN